MTNFIGIILGGDMNSYAVARAFYEKYKIKTIVLGKFPIYPTKDSKITECYYNKDILKTDVLLNELTKINGIGKVKAITLLSAIELEKVLKEEMKSVTEASVLALYVSPQNFS